MAENVGFEITNKGDIKKMLTNYKDNIIEEFMDDWGDAVMFEAKKLLRSGKIENSDDPFGGGAFDKGGIYKSGLIVRTKPNERKVKFTAPHSRYIEYGTPPHHPPVLPLQQWARRNGLKNWQSAGWAIAKKIAKFGTMPKPFLRQATKTVQTRIKDIFKNTIKRIDSL